MKRHPGHDAAEKGMEAKLKDFVEKGEQVYAKA